MTHRHARVVAQCKGCKAREYVTPTGRTSNWNIDGTGYCVVCRNIARQAETPATPEPVAEGQTSLF